MISKSDLDKRICDCEECNNTETYREFITSSEEEMGIDPADIDNMTDEELNKYFEFIDYLWEK